MKYEIVTTDDFEKHFKKLAKKYRSLDGDYEILINDLLKNPTMGDDLGGNFERFAWQLPQKTKAKAQAQELSLATC